MCPQRLAQVPSHGLCGVECGLRLLEDHGDTGTADRVEVAFGGVQHLDAVDLDRAGRDRVLGEQAYRRTGGHRLAGAGFAYQGDDLAAIDAQADVGDGRTRVVEGDSKGVDLQCGCGINCCAAATSYSAWWPPVCASTRS